MSSMTTATTDGRIPAEVRTGMITAMSAGTQGSNPDLLSGFTCCKVTEEDSRDRIDQVTVEPFGIWFVGRLSK